MLAALRLRRRDRADGGYGVVCRPAMIRKIGPRKYRLYSRHRDPKTGRRRNLGTFTSRRAAEQHERAVQFFKRRG
jgi:hypothetical protein